MKRHFITLMLIVFSLPSYCQFHVDVGAGITINKELAIKNQVTQKTYPNIEIVAGYEVHNFLIQGEMKPAITRTSLAPSYFGGALGFRISNVILTGGYYYNLITTNDKSLNIWKLGGSLEYCWKLGKKGGIYGKVMYVNSTVVITSGVRINII
jgi:hypothetical protein